MSIDLPRWAKAVGAGLVEAVLKTSLMGWDCIRFSMFLVINVLHTATGIIPMGASLCTENEI
jgi:hypothetical protein